MATAVVGVLLALAALLTAAPAQAVGPNDLEISLDGGVTWSTTPSGQLFDGVQLVVPGDSVDDQLILRNVGDTTGVIRMTLRDVSYSDPVFAGVLTVRIDTIGFPGTAVALTGASPCVVLSAGQTLAPGQQLTVNAHAELGDLHGSDGQNAVASFTIRAALHEVGAVPQAPSYCDVVGADVSTGPGSNPGQIAYTGQELPVPLIAGAAALLGAGLFLFLAARRRRKDDGTS